MTEAKLLQQLKDFPFVLAPMAGITDRPFRSFMRELGTGIVVTELVSANGLKYNSEKTRKLMEYDEAQRPIGIQIFGETPEAMAEAAKEVEQFGADFVDINFGCPVPKVVKKGAGSALLKDLVAFGKMLTAVKSAVQIPVTIKVRTGWDENTRNTDQVVQIAYSEGMTWVAIHGRTRAAGYSGRADWDYIAQVKAQSPLPIIGNGDIASAAQAVQRLQESGCDAVMIGRGCLKNPWIFLEALKKWKGHSEKIGRNHLELINRLKMYLEQSENERVVLLQLKKFSSWYSSGYPEASAFRRAAFQCHSVEELYPRIQDYFSSVSQINQLDTSSEAFLMGGHG